MSSGQNIDRKPGRHKYGSCELPQGLLLAVLRSGKPGCIPIRGGNHPHRLLHWCQNEMSHCVAIEVGPRSEA